MMEKNIYQNIKHNIRDTIAQQIYKFTNKQYKVKI